MFLPFVRVSFVIIKCKEVLVNKQLSLKTTCSGLIIINKIFCLQRCLHGTFTCAFTQIYSENRKHLIVKSCLCSIPTSLIYFISICSVYLFASATAQLIFLYSRSLYRSLTVSLLRSFKTISKLKFKNWLAYKITFSFIHLLT